MIAGDTWPNCARITRDGIWRGRAVPRGNRVYGVLASQVIERRRQIGIRMALGSSASDVCRLVMRDGARMTLLGIVAGFAAPPAWRG
jgi:hypothetical protein